ELEPVREDGPAPMLAVDDVGVIEEVALRGVSALIATAGPYAGAIIRGSELRLCLDAHALAEFIGASREAASREEAAAVEAGGAARAGSEPADQFPDRTLSKRVPSATRPPLPSQRAGCQRRPRGHPGPGKRAPSLQQPDVSTRGLRAAWGTLPACSA